MNKRCFGDYSIQIKNHCIKLGLKCHIVYLYFVMSIKVSKFIEAFKSCCQKILL